MSLISNVLDLRVLQYMHLNKFDNFDSTSSPLVIYFFYHEA